MKARLSVSFLCLCVCFCTALTGKAERTCSSSQDEAIQELERELAATEAVLQEATRHEEKLHKKRTWRLKTLSRLQNSKRVLRSLLQEADGPDHVSTSLLAKRAACSNSEHLRLVNGSSEVEGRLEVRVGDAWTNVCEDGWTVDSARLVCSMLGYPGPAVAATGSFVFGDGGLAPLLSPASSCSSSAGLICGDLQSYPVRLVNGSSPEEGRVEVRVGGQWGTIAHDSWNREEATVICNMLGFRSGVAAATGGALFGQGAGRVWTDNLNCRGDEQHILSCPSTYPVGYRVTWSHTADVGVICGNFHHYQIRLVNGSSEREGRVEVKVGGEWTSVYDANWDYLEAQVVCRALGYNWQGARAVLDSGFGKGNGLQRLAFLNCDGSERHLMECRTSFAFGSGTYNNHNDDAGVICPP